MTTDAPLLLARDGAVATIRFNRPGALNAIDVPMANAFLAAARELAADKGVRAVLMSGAGKGFMAGGDLGVLSADPKQGAADLIGPLHEALRVLDAMDAPLVAQVHGVAAGAGLSLMLQADFVLAAEGTRFNLAYVNIGTSCDVGASWACAARWKSPCSATPTTRPPLSAWAWSTAWCPPPSWRPRRWRWRTGWPRARPWRWATCAG
jgi:2-(1,2-epoxy-1,2-dihydrophenyl)acetyl-CoA isomerase